VELCSTQCCMEKCHSETPQKRNSTPRSSLEITNSLTPFLKRQEILSNQSLRLNATLDILSSKFWIILGWNNREVNLVRSTLISRWSKSKRSLTWTLYIKMTPSTKKRRT
jgi:hypothetical protein